MSAFPMEKGKVGSDFCETRQQVHFQRNREKQVVSPSSSHGKLMTGCTMLYKIRNVSISDMSLEMCRAEKQYIQDFQRGSARMCLLKYSLTGKPPIG